MHVIIIVSNKIFITKSNINGIQTCTKSQGICTSIQKLVSDANRFCLAMTVAGTSPAVTEHSGRERTRECSPVESAGLGSRWRRGGGKSGRDGRRRGGLKGWEIGEDGRRRGGLNGWEIGEDGRR